METKISLYEALKNRVKGHEKEESLYYMSHSFSKSHVLSCINKTAGFLKKNGVNKNSVVTVCLPNIPEAVYSLYAINQIGAIANIVHPLMKKEQLEKTMEKCHSNILIMLDQNYLEFKPLLSKGIKFIVASPVDELPFVYSFMYKKVQKIKKDLKYKDLALPKVSSSSLFLFKDILKEKEYLGYEKLCFEDAIYLHSGGTTGESKTIALSSYALNELANQGLWIIDISKDRIPTYHMMAVLPMFHGFGLCMGIHTLMFNGGVSTIMPKFSSDTVCKYLKKNKINCIIGIPTLYQALLKNKKFKGKRLKNLHVCFVGGDGGNQKVFDEFNARMKENGSGAKLFEGYGLTETVTVSNVNTFRYNKAGTVGVSLPITKTQIIDENKNVLPPLESGEICISGTTLMNGYRFGNEEDPIYKDKDGVMWLRTGDLGYLDKDGFLFFKQRIKRLIKVNGINIYPSDVEKVVQKIKGVKECAVISLKDEERGHMVGVYIVGDASTIDVDALKDAISRECSIYARPKEVYFVEELPHTLIGKVDYKVLEKRHEHE